MQHDNFKDDFETVDALLHKRYSPRAPRDLGERIIHRALHTLRDVPPPYTLWAELRAMLALPHPSVVMASGVILGVVVGLQAGDGLTMLSQDWTSFLEINEGGWL